MGSVLEIFVLVLVTGGLFTVGQGCQTQRTVAKLGDDSAVETGSDSLTDTEDSPDSDSEDLPDSDSEFDTETETTGECPEALVIDGPGSYQGSMALENRFELSTDANCWTVDLTVHSDGPDNLWQLDIEADQTVIIEIKQVSWTGVDCQMEMVLYLLAGCSHDPDANCFSDQALCQGDATCVQATWGDEPPWPRLTIGPEVASRRYWLVFDTASPCEAEYHFSVEVQ